MDGKNSLLGVQEAVSSNLAVPTLDSIVYRESQGSLFFCPAFGPAIKPLARVLAWCYKARVRPPPPPRRRPMGGGFNFPTVALSIGEKGQNEFQHERMDRAFLGRFDFYAAGVRVDV